jgi:hypothetical protein
MLFWNKPKNLKQWLGIATKHLAWFEAEKITREITAHFEDELEHQRQLGKSDSQAQVLALTELGNPHHANQLFIKTHLTTTEWDAYINHNPQSESKYYVAGGFTGLF